MWGDDARFTSWRKVGPRWQSRGATFSRNPPKSGRDFGFRAKSCGATSDPPGRSGFGVMAAGPAPESARARFGPESLRAHPSERVKFRAGSAQSRVVFAMIPLAARKFYRAARFRVLIPVTHQKFQR
jgi:hypothetical protein